ncbi:MAG TPA: glycosyltransferase family 2 protein [Polyangiaceae bacterium]
MSPDYRPDLVSIIVPTHNRANLVVNAAESALKQLHRPVELVVVDDGSTDGTERILTDWGHHHTTTEFAVRYLKKPKGGAPSARNEGLLHSRGEFVQFLDSDDALGRHKLTAQVGVLKRFPEIDYVWSRSVRSKQYLPLDESTPRAPLRIYRDRKRVVAPMRVSDGLYRRSICVAVGPWNVRLHRYQDWEYNIRALSLCRSVAFLDIVAYVVLLHDSARISRTTKHVYAEQIFAAYEELNRCAYPYVDDYLKRFMCSQALTSASFLLLEEGALQDAANAARLARREAPLSQQKAKALAYELGLRLAPRMISRFVR